MQNKAGLIHLTDGAFCIMEHHRILSCEFATKFNILNQSGDVMVDFNVNMFNPRIDRATLLRLTSVRCDHV